MKQLSKITFRSFLTLFMISVLQTMAWAQDNATSGSNSSTTQTTQETHYWYTQPWVWVVGGAVLILILVALLRGGGKGDSTTSRVTVTKTVSTDD